MSNFLQQVYENEMRTQKQFKNTTIRARDKEFLGKSEDPEAIYEIMNSKTKPSYTKKVVRVQERDNRGHNRMQKELLKEGYLLIDSSYTQASNPCSMRNFGPTRNVIYNFSPVKVSDSDSERSKVSRTQTTEKKSRDALVYKRSRVPHDWDVQSDASLHLTVVRANDYTKNISSSIFAPGEILSVKSQADAQSIAKSSVVNEKPYTRKPEHKMNNDIRPRIPSGYKSGKEVKKMIIDGKVQGRKAEALIKKTKQSLDGIWPPKKSTQICHQLKDEINNEKRIKEHLRQELAQLKQEMQNRLELVNMKMSGQSFYK